MAWDILNYVNGYSCGCVIEQLRAGGADECNILSGKASNTLLAAVAPCDQQDTADAMIDLAKKLNNDADMIKLAQIFVQEPRNTVRSAAQIAQGVVSNRHVWCS